MAESHAEESLVELTSLVEAENVSHEGHVPNRRKESWGAVRAISICSIITILITSAGLVSYKLSRKLTQSGKGDLIDDANQGAETAFYTASTTGYHFQPAKNWMNDPNAPMFYGGYYHFFYQYNPDAAVWGNISWGHAVSTDLIHWIHLEVALSPDHWYDIDGVWSGSATIRKDGTPAIMYTGGRKNENGDYIQSQALALPADPKDPLLRKWVKANNNPIINPPVGHRSNDFRDPATAWLEDDGFWRLIIGTKLDIGDGSQDGMSLLYKSADFVNWVLEENSTLHRVPGTGMWECVDFFPVAVKPTSGLGGQAGCLTQAGENFGLEHHAALKGENYLDTYKYALKASLSNRGQDYYTIGTYSTETHKFTVDDPALDLGRGHRYDYGKAYASKTFYDSSTGRRILWSWVSESDTREDDIVKGWASLQSIPRTLWLDGITHTSLLTWPVEEVDALRGAKSSVQNIVLKDGDVIRVEGGDGPQLDVVISFEKPNVSALGNVNPEEFDCSQGGSAKRGILGPFGVLVHTDDAQTEQTAVFFFISPMKDGQWSTLLCSDQSRSSLAENLDKAVYGSYLTVLPTENELHMRLLLDHSIVETFAQGGRIAITSRVYPTVALNESSHLFLFNNGSTPVRVMNLDVYKMADVHMITI